VSVSTFKDIYDKPMKTVRNIATKLLLIGRKECQKYERQIRNSRVKVCMTTNRKGRAEEH